MYKVSLALLGAGFALAFGFLVLPAMWASGDVIGAFAGGFVNPYATGYALDAIFCWLVLAVWVVYEAKTLNLRHGWVALVLGVIPGVATGFALYLLLRMGQLKETKSRSLRS
ncbi:MAG: DUF2834 domain-containing protein [Moraxellaceae bacterium]|nr:DUF2834 domain-containing protein [Moraxellaceae bacterium]MDZ4387722.1 DUF2834 domain-containing protein [Moraxellaceae bacterium]